MSTLLASQLDLNVIWKILSMISKFVIRNIFFFSVTNNLRQHLEMNLEINFIPFTFYHSKYKKQSKYFTLILLLSGDTSLNSGPPYSSQIDGLSWNVFDLHINVTSLLPWNYNTTRITC